MKFDISVRHTRCRLLPGIGILLALLFSTTARADITFDGFTRFIFEGKQKQLPVIIVNQGNQPALVQVKLDWGDKQGTGELPMAVSKPLLLIPANSKASTDILYQGVGLPDDRESFLLLKVLQIPKKTVDSNAMAIALQHNLKLFYRPPLPGSVSAGVEQLHWSPAAAGRYRARNDSPYYLTLTEVALLDQSGVACGQAIDHLMIAPFSSYSLNVKGCDRPVSQVAYAFISDAGLSHARRSNL
ncbi:fimbrial biogenesis chaperone [Pseudomonas donghuensis]|uniref:fimbrial biogenesis chaperone n=1 Tax=Pseudomonas donghuensis TaxID=1163398 RepID=UPI00029AB844|nr:molecular chaperone [Pseudomonas donghuensis]MDF9893536.1 P pilus assembly chaperone PapD [Pseudomonas vranovensis]MCP6694609.1 molecular chaperone [Pseudomonas donghuensis]MCP6698053.1 molecular chaperone [Pseudomonas donghuensis]PJY96081.1 pilus assembly protein [Pseudomonas donghuensis]UVL31867.1 molecular chaperone [Pseudomonas donghuensis]